MTYGGKDFDLVAYSDADWASNPNDWKSILGNAYLLDGAVIGWLSKKQSVTTNSTCDAKYVFVAFCARHVIWLRKLFYCSPKILSSISSPKTLIYIITILGIRFPTAWSLSLMS